MYRGIIVIVVAIFCVNCSSDRGTFVDSRDGHEYQWIRIGSQIWMSENLAYLPDVHTIQNNSLTEPRYYVYGNNAEDLSKAKELKVSSDGDREDINVYSEFGVLYNWAAVTNGNNPDNQGRLQGVCPVGWHVPSDEEWMELEHFLGMEELDLPAIGIRSSGDVTHLIKSESMWDNDGNGTNSSGLSIKPSGEAYSGTDFISLNKKAILWSSSLDINNSVWTREVNCCDNGVIRRSKYLEDGYAIRCIKD